MKITKLPVLPMIAFVSGFSLMTFELAAARVLAPSIGSSTYVWTSVIGVIIAALSLGYWAGGRVADARNRLTDIAWLCLMVAAAITLTLLTYQNMLELITGLFRDARLQGVAASLVLFAPTSFLLGALSPYLVKRKVTSLATSGQSFASLSALESIGGIMGTFITGFVLFSYIGAREAFAVVALLVVVSSWIIVPRQLWRWRLLASIGIVGVCVLSLNIANDGHIDTPSAHYTVFDSQIDGRQIRGIATGPGAVQSGIFLGAPDELAFWYTRQLADVVASAPEKETILVLGGGAFTLPRYLADTYPDSTIDVVEIDPELVAIARDQFYYDDPENVRIFFQDARTYVNQSTQKYDIILVDVYGDASVPFSLMTREYGQQIQRLLHKNGIVGANFIAGKEGACGKLLGALDAPYSHFMPHAMHTQNAPYAVSANLVVAYSAQPVTWEGAQALRLEPSPVYTDNYVPAERLQQACQNAA